MPKVIDYATSSPRQPLNLGGILALSIGLMLLVLDVSLLVLTLSELNRPSNNWGPHQYAFEMWKALAWLTVPVTAVATAAILIALRRLRHRETHKMACDREGTICVHPWLLLFGWVHLF